MAGAVYNIDHRVMFSVDGSTEDLDAFTALPYLRNDNGSADPFYIASLVRSVGTLAAQQTFGIIPYATNLTSNDSDYTSPSPPSPPTITYVPADGTPIIPTASLQVDVTSDGELAAVTIGIRYPAGGYEVVYDGQAFAAGYSGSVSTLSNGLRFIFSRVGGYAATPALIVIAVDSFGQVTRT